MQIFEPPRLFSSARPRLAGLDVRLDVISVAPGAFLRTWPGLGASTIWAKDGAGVRVEDKPS